MKDKQYGYKNNNNQLSYFNGHESQISQSLYFIEQATPLLAGITQ